MDLPLTVSGLKVAGDDGRPILEVADLTVASGASVCVRGPSGAGKSTFLFAIAGLLALKEGRVRWGDTEISALTDARRAAFRRQAIGMVFQDFLLFEELTAGANSALAGAYSAPSRRAAISKRADSLLQRLGVAGAGRSVASYSGGERQRVAVARALATDPAIILADEPTASLDRDAADRLVDDLVRLAREEGKTLIAVSHDPAVHARVDRLIDIVDGRIASETSGGG